MRTTLFVVLAIAVAAATARAQPAGAQAEILFKRGIEYLDAGKIAQACEAFDASQKLEPTVSTLLNQANCREQNKQYATAWGLFLEARRQTLGATGRNADFHAVAVEHAAALEPRLSRLTIKVDPKVRVPGLEIRRDAEPVSVGAWNQALPIDGGRFTISARAPGYETWSVTIDVGVERDTNSVDIPRLKLAPKPPARKRAKLPLVLGGSAIVLVGAALGFELSARGTYDEAAREPDDALQISLWERANTKRYIAEGIGAAGLACAGVAVWLYVRHRRESPPQLQLVPTVGGTRSAGLQLLGSF